MNRNPGARRVMGLIVKESIQIFRDPSSIAIAFVMPVFLLLLFGYGVSMDADKMDIAIVSEQRGPDTQSFVDAFANSRYFKVKLANDRREAQTDIVNGRVKAIIVLPADFSRKSGRGDQAPLQVQIDGTDPNTANLMRGYIEGAWQAWMRQDAEAQGQEFKPPVEMEPRVWFNPELRSRNFLVPGLISVIMTLIGTLLTALVVAREWERGTMEALLATPVGVLEILIGKILPYFVLGMAAMASSVVLAITLFEVPLRGSILILALVSSVFLMSSLAVGLFISTLARTQFVAGMAALVAAFLPAFMLSGFVFEISSMPWMIRMLTHLVAARYFVPCLQTLFLAGNIWGVILPNIAAMAVLTAVFLGLSARKTSNRLD